MIVSKYLHLSLVRPRVTRLIGNIGDIYDFMRYYYIQNALNIEIIAFKKITKSFIGLMLGVIIGLRY